MSIIRTECQTYNIEPLGLVSDFVTDGLDSVQILVSKEDIDTPACVCIWLAISVLGNLLTEHYGVYDWARRVCETQSY